MKAFSLCTTALLASIFFVGGSNTSFSTDAPAAAPKFFRKILVSPSCSGQVCIFQMPADTKNRYINWFSCILVSGNANFAYGSVYFDTPEEVVGYAAPLHTAMDGNNQVAIVEFDHRFRVPAGKKLTLSFTSVGEQAPGGSCSVEGERG